MQLEFNMAARQFLDTRIPEEFMKDTANPRRIFLFSGKRKSGKDYITDLLHKRISAEKSTIVRLSGPIKSHWAKSLNLDITKLLGDGEYKEEYRLKMVKWGENKRKEDYGYFCHAALDMYNAWSTPVWIISDIRRKSDIQWFTENYGSICRTVRVVSSEEVRQKRGWTFTSGIDDAETECDLDDLKTWHLLVENNNNTDIESVLQKLVDMID